MAQQAAQHMDPALAEAMEHDNTSTGQPHRKVLMWAFLGSECMFFAALIGAFLVYQDSHAAGPDRHEVFSKLFLVSVMAFVLLLSSFTMVLGLAAARRGDQKMMTVWLLVTALCGLFFIGAQGYEFYQFVNHEHITPRTSNFVAAFMILTGFHGAHVTGGILWLVSVVLLVRLHPSQKKLPITKTLLPKFLSVLSGIPQRAEGEMLEPRPRHRRFAAFVRRQFQAPPPAPSAAALSVDEYKARHLAEERILNVEIVGLYWHFVDIVWVVIFTVVYLFAASPGE